MAAQAQMVASTRSGYLRKLHELIGHDPRDHNWSWANEWSELVIQTHLPTSGASGTDITSRNHINILSSDVVLALPGGPGTLSEVELAVIYQTPCLACLGQAEGGATIDGRSSEAELGVPLARSVEEVDAFLQRHLGGRLLDQSL